MLHPSSRPARRELEELSKLSLMTNHDIMDEQKEDFAIHELGILGTS